MGFMEELSENELLRLLVPIGIGIAVTVLAILLRNFIYWRLHGWAAKTETEWDDIVIASTRFASLLWCFVLGIYAGIEFAVVPQSWEGHINDVVPILFIAMGIYTGVIIVKVFLDWYMVAVAQKTASPLDDLIIGALKWIVPFIAGVLGLLLILDMAGYEVPAVKDWLKDYGPRLGLLAGIGLILVLGVTAAFPKFVRRAVIRSREDQTEEELNKRVETLAGVLVAAFQAIVIAVIGFMMLSELGLDIAPMIA